MSRQDPSADSERYATDSGAFADKVAASDPAAAPLGTDDEAAGQPTGAAMRGAPRRPAPSGGIKAGPPPSGREWLVMLPILAVIAAFGIGWFWMN